MARFIPVMLAVALYATSAPDASAQWKPGKVIRGPDGAITLAPRDGDVSRPENGPSTRAHGPARPAGERNPVRKSLAGSRPAPLQPHTAEQPALVLLASPVEVVSGGNIALHWQAANATSCAASGGWTGARTVSGQFTSDALVADTSFFLACKNGTHSVTRSARVTVTPRPVAPHPLATLEPGHWSAPPASNFTRACPARPPYSYHADCRSLVGDWNGGAYDPSRDRFLMWGGGHAGYAGNEVYAYDIKGLKWLRLSEPSILIYEPDGAAWYPGDEPNTHHSIDSLEYLPTLDKLLVGNGYAPYLPWGTPKSFRNGGGCRLFDLSTRQWERCPFVAKMTAYDPVDDLVYGYGQYYTFDEYDPRLNRTRKLSTWHDTLAVDMTAAFDSKRGKVVAIGGKKLLVYDPANPPRSGRAWQPTLRGESEIVDAVAPGFEYVAPVDRFFAWSGGTAVYVLDPESWTWTRIPPAATNRFVPPPAMGRGTFGRFRYLAAHDAFIVVNERIGNVYFWKRSR